MSLLRSAHPRRLRLATAILVGLVAIGAGYEVTSTSPTYLETATVMFWLPKSEASPKAYYIFVVPLITSAEAMIQIMMSPRVQNQIRAAIPSADVQVSLVNLYNQEYPDYGVPLATLSATSHSAGAAHHAFEAASQRLIGLVTHRQAVLGVRPRNRITAQVIADSGTLLQPGSRKRSLAGLIALAGLALAFLWNLADRFTKSGPARYAGPPAAYPTSLRS